MSKVGLYHLTAVVENPDGTKRRVPLCYQQGKSASDRGVITTHIGWNTVKEGDKCPHCKHLKVD